jgi:hypothetical protein
MLFPLKSISPSIASSFSLSCPDLLDAVLLKAALLQAISSGSYHNELAVVENGTFAAIPLLPSEWNHTLSLIP